MLPANAGAVDNAKFEKKKKKRGRKGHVMAVVAKRVK